MRQRAGDMPATRHYKKHRPLALRRYFGETVFAKSLDDLAARVKRRAAGRTQRREKSDQAFLLFLGAAGLPKLPNKSPSARMNALLSGAAGACFAAGAFAFALAAAYVSDGVAATSGADTTSAAA